ncbi:MAG: HAD family hydrolase [Anaerolineales bacterium]|nr:HAD family hydrolase [Anaerolineales bacterium]MCB8939162.1 HAD family hydrolase [Ardenticatenaceae bacterium]
MARISAVLFDLDDTLIDWSGVQVNMAEIETRHLQNVHRFLTSQGHLLPPFADFWGKFRETLIYAWAEAKKDWSGVSFVKEMQTFLLDCGLDEAQLDLDTVLHVYDWQTVPGVEPFSDTLPVLEKLKTAGYKIGLITNAMQPMWMRDIELRAYGILDYLDARLTSGDVGFMKPHPFIYWRALELLDVQPEEAIFVGDRPANDIAGANEAGLTSVLMSPPHLNRELNGVRPNFTITTLTELLTILTQLEGNYG